MSIDLEKLTPAPWGVHRPQQSAGTNWWLVNGPDGKGCWDSKDNAEFIALARNAFDVMMRTGCNVRRESDGKWYVYGGDVWHSEQVGWGDPFTALVEASSRQEVKGRK